MPSLYIRRSPYSSEPGYGANYGVNQNGYGVVGDSSAAAYAGVLGRDGNGTGVRGQGGPSGVKGEGLNGVLGYSQAPGFAGVYGIASNSGNCSNAAPSTICYGLIGNAVDVPFPGGVGVMGIGSDAGIWGRASVPAAYAAIFDGTVHLNGLLDAPSGEIRAVSIKPDLNGVRNLGFGGLGWNFVVANHFSNPSDARLKHDVLPISEGLGAVLALNPVSFIYNDGDGSRQLGLIAQEAQQVVPEVVNAGDDEERLLTLDYSKLVPVLIKAIQEQQAEIESLKARADLAAYSAAGSADEPAPIERGTALIADGGGAQWLAWVTIASTVVVLAAGAGARIWRRRAA
ncbi:hypothetical protein AYO38_01440 [bacterium SCGC AG-212-C10]|nr:hypothetical protein AYO38_01440 [bacterium SCGC AG-212-C10]